jgi:ElaB/YqjD/DUF883 family membrane-anchored ribosome-binding protein
LSFAATDREATANGLPVRGESASSFNQERDIMDVSKSNVDRTANQAHRAVDNAAETAAAKAGPAIERAAQAVHQTVDKVAQAAGPAAEWLNESTDQLRQKQDEVLENCRSYIRHRPLATIAIAIAAGYLVGRLGR